MDAQERKAIVAAMELLARQVNDEDVFELWLEEGVADEDLDYMAKPEEVDEYYIRDENFRDLMDTFLTLMSKARKSGGLVADGICTKQG